MKTNVTLLTTMLLTFISGGTTISYNQIKNNDDASNYDTSITYHSHAEQMVHSDGDDVNTDFDSVKWHDVNFEQTFKEIYLSNKNTYTNVDKILLSLKQTNVCTDTNDSGTCGGKGYSWDMNNRIHDWTNDFRDNLYLHLSPDAPNFGYSKQNLFLKEKRLLDFKQSYRSLTCPTKFGEMYNNPNDINFNVGVHRDFTSGNWNVYGVNKAFIKETAHIDVIYNWVDRFLWTLNAGDAPHQSKISSIDEGYYPIRIDENGIDVGSYNIDHLIKVSNPDYQTKSIRLMLNNEYVDFIKLWHDDLKNKSIDELDEQQKSLVKQFEITNLDDPWLILNKIANKITFNIKYEVSDPMKINEFKAESISMTYSQLKQGINIYLNKNENNNYLFKLDEITVPEIISNDTYIDGCKTTNINNEYSQIKDIDNGFYELLAPSIKEINFRSSVSDSIKYIYPTSLGDLEILKLFVTLTDNYGLVDDYSLLTPAVYEIQRDDLNGEVIIMINVNNVNLYKTFSGFKKANDQANNLDASKIGYNIITKELDDRIIRKIFIVNGFSENIINDSSFEIINPNDDIDNYVNVQITNGTLVNHKYLITGIQPYYLDLKKSIDKKYLSMKPSSVDVNKLRQKYLDISNEFLSRNQESLSFTLKPNDDEETLLVKASYYEEIDKKYENIYLTITFLSQNNKQIWLWIIVSFGILTITVGVWFVIRKTKKDKIMKDKPS